jgi:hypothetical protein
MLVLGRNKEGAMARKKHTVEQIIGKLREAEVALSKDQTVLQACRTLSTHVRRITLSVFG